MQVPSIPSGVVEQAIYTWSSLNVTGGKGEGFGAISPGLEPYKQWLSELDTRPLRLFAPDVERETDVQWNYENFEGFGRFRTGNLGIAYKKMASGGLDSLRRPRYVVHLLIGDATDVDLLWASETGADLFYDARAMPLDRLPSLDSLACDYPFGSLDEGPGDLWSKALERNARLVGELALFSPDEHSLPSAGLDRDLIKAAWILHPEGWWPYPTVNAFVGALGPVLRVGADYRSAVDTVPKLYQPLARARAPLAVPDYRSGKPIEADAVNQYEVLLADSGLPVRNVDGGVSERKGDLDDGTGKSPSIRGVIEELVERLSQSGANAGVGQEYLNEVGSQSALRQIRKHEIRPQDLLAEAWDHLAPITLGVTTRGPARDWAQYFAPVGLDRIAEAWRRTGLAVLLYSAALKLRDGDRVSLACRRPRGQQIEQALTWVTSEQDNAAILARLLDGGLLSVPESRRATVRFISERPRLLFGKVVPLMNAPDSTIVDLIRESFEQWADYRGLSDAERRAVGAQLMRRRLSRRLFLGS